jgi:NAD(P)-dependent dehydrogenase (short-subunit alcohol dehydrogenase family)
VEEQVKDTGRLAGKVAFITGAGAGIARAAARLFAREGARVLIAELSPGSGAAAEAEVRAAGDEALFVQTDATDDASVRAAVAACVARFGRLDVLFNCAGGSSPADAAVTDVELGVLQQALDLNLRSAFLCCRHAIPELVRAGGGSIVNMASVVALDGSMPLHAYAAAKGAVISLTRSLAGRYSPERIRANVICPGMVLTERIRARFDAAGNDPAALGPIDLHTHPFAIGEPEDIANVALFLASDESRMLTGAVIPAEGGLSAF